MSFLAISGRSRTQRKLNPRENFSIYGIHSKFLHIDIDFYAPGLKGPSGASSNWIVCLSVHLSLCLSVCRSVIPSRLHLKFGWWYSNQTWTLSSSMGSLHFTDIPCPWGGVGSICRTFAIFWHCCHRGHPCFTNTCLVCNHVIPSFLILHILYRKKRRLFTST